MNQSVSTPTPVLWQVLEAARELSARLEGALAEVDLSLPKVGVLKILADAGESLPLSELAECHRCVRSNMTQLIDRLEADGLVVRESDPLDRRIRRAALTPAGRKAYLEGQSIVESHEREVARLLSPADADALARALGRLTP